MLQPRTLRFSLLMLLALISLFSCAGAPTPPTPEVTSLDWKILDEGEIRAAFGSKLETNPFLVPTRMFMPINHEFIVLRLSSRLASSEAFDFFSARALDSEGKVIARYYDRDSLIGFWEDWNSDPTVIGSMRDRISRFCLPSAPVQLPRGRSTRAFVLIGKKPLARPLTIEFNYRFGSGSPELKMLTLP